MNQSTMYRIAYTIESYYKIAGKRCFWNRSVNSFGCKWEDVTIYPEQVKYYVKASQIIPCK